MSPKPFLNRKHVVIVGAVLAIVLGSRYFPPLLDGCQRESATTPTQRPHAVVYTTPDGTARVSFPAAPTLEASTAPSANGSPAARTLAYVVDQRIIYSLTFFAEPIAAESDLAATMTTMMDGAVVGSGIAAGPQREVTLPGLFARDVDLRGEVRGQPISITMRAIIDLTRRRAYLLSVAFTGSRAVDPSVVQAFFATFAPT